MGLLQALEMQRLRGEGLDAVHGRLILPQKPPQQLATHSRPLAPSAPHPRRARTRFSLHYGLAVLILDSFAHASATHTPPSPCKRQTHPSQPLQAPHTPLPAPASAIKRLIPGLAYT